MVDKRSAGLALLAVVLAGCLTASTQTAGPAAGGAQLGVLVVINNGTANLTRSVSVANGSNALEAFQLAAVLNVTRHPAYGAFVTGVNGLEGNAGGNGRYWQYYVDGALAPVGVEAYKLERNVTLEFRYEVPPEGQWG